MRLETSVAVKIIAAIDNRAKELGKSFSVAVVDASGYLIALRRMDGAGFLTPQIAEAKAFSAAAWGKPTVVIAERARAKPETFQAFINIGRTQLVPGQGGRPLEMGGLMVGAIGVSGGSGEEDEEMCAVGCAAFNQA